MENKEIIVMCCFCGLGLSIDTAVQIEIKPIESINETQAVYCHKKCINKALHKSVPRHPDLLDND
jgi:hypothetical protein